MSWSEKRLEGAVNIMRSSLYSLRPDSLNDMLVRLKSGSADSAAVTSLLGYVN